MNDVIVDTNIVIWYFSLPKLPSVAAQSAITEAFFSGAIIVASITIVELTYLNDKNRIPADVTTALREALDEPASAIRLIELNREISDAVEHIPKLLSLICPTASLPQPLYILACL